MSDKEFQEYIKDIIKKYDYYDRVKDRLEILRFGKAKQSKLLDVGAGYLSILAVKKLGCKVTCIDISKKKLEKTKKEAKKEGVLKNIRFIKANAVKLPFPKNSFDVSVSFGALHHCGKEYPQVVREMFRVTKKRVVVSEMTGCGVHIFDEYLHPEENHKAMLLNLESLKKLLQYYSKKVERFDRKCFTTFVCQKNIGGKLK